MGNHAAVQEELPQDVKIPLDSTHSAEAPSLRGIPPVENQRFPTG